MKSLTFHVSHGGWSADLQLGADHTLYNLAEAIIDSVGFDLDHCFGFYDNLRNSCRERGSTNELIAFLYIARGSAGEVRSMLCYFERRPALVDFKSEISDLKSLAESCSRQLRAWADSLQNSDIKGPRHLNSQSRNEWEKKATREANANSFAAREREIISKLSSDDPPAAFGNNATARSEI